MRDPGIRALLLLLAFSVTLALKARGASLQRRKPDPVNFFCCGKPSVDKGFDSDSDFVIHSAKASTKEQPEAPVPELSGPYPTHLSDPFILTSGERIIGGVIALSQKRNKVILIQDRSGTGGWRLPERESGANDPELYTAVLLEAWRSAGLIAEDRVPEFVGEVKTNIETDKVWYQYYKFVVAERHSKWPNMARWERKWATIDDAVTLLKKDHPDQADMLKQGVKVQEENQGNP